MLYIGRVFARQLSVTSFSRDIVMTSLTLLLLFSRVTVNHSNRPFWTAPSFLTTDQECKSEQVVSKSHGCPYLHGRTLPSLRNLIFKKATACKQDGHILCLVSGEDECNKSMQSLKEETQLFIKCLIKNKYFLLSYICKELLLSPSNQGLHHRMQFPNPTLEGSLVLYSISASFLSYCLLCQMFLFL